MEQTLTVGIIRAVHGLAGKVKVESTSGETQHFFMLTDVTLRKGEKEIRQRIESVENGTSYLLVKFKGIDTPEQAKAFMLWEIAVPRSMACPLRANEYYAEDLKGCTLLYYGGAQTETADLPLEAGVVTGVLEGGNGDLLEVAVAESVNTVDIRADKKEDAQKKRTALVPFKKEFIGAVDIEHGTIQLMHLWILE